MTTTATNLLTDEEIFAATRACIEAWNSLDLEAVLATYTEDVIYQDPGTSGQIVGKPDLHRYLAKFLTMWDMQFRVTEERRIAHSDAQVCLWEVDVRRRDGRGGLITAPGMDIIHVRGNQLSRDEVFMDRTLLVPLLEA